MVSVEDLNSTTTSRFPQTRPYYYSPSSSSIKIQRSLGRSMRTVRSNFYQSEQEKNSSELSQLFSDLTDSVLIDIRLGEYANKSSCTHKNSLLEKAEFSEISQAFSDISSAYSSDISGELQRLACVPEESQNVEYGPIPEPASESEPCSGFLRRESFSTEIIESISPEDLQPTVKLCIDGLNSKSIAVKRSAAAKLRLLAKNRADNRALIGESGAVPALIPLLRDTDPYTQEHAVTALLNLSLHEANKALITNAGAIKSLIYVLKTGTDTSKQNAACALLSLALIDENKLSIGACGAIPPLVALLLHGTNRGKKDALTTLYKLCSVNLNKERAISAGAVRPLVGLVTEEGTGLSEKAMVVLSSLAAIDEGREAIVEEGGLANLVEAIEDGSHKGKEFAVLTLLQLCADNVRNRVLLVREGAIPPLVALSQAGTPKAKHKAERLLGYLREQRREIGSTSSTPTP